MSRGESARVGRVDSWAVSVRAGGSSWGVVSVFATRVAGALRSSWATATLSGAWGSDGCCTAVDGGAGSGAR